ncbi:MAG: CaiB/BaiF CoA-transferase family protein [Candidatus Methanomethylicia archaeon]
MSKRDELLAKLFSLEGKPSVLEGIKVVEISKSNLSGSMVGALLKELGAEVLKIEPPNGDPAKNISPYGVNIGGIGIPYFIENIGKKIIYLDLELEEEREKLKKLLLSCDVVVDAVKPGYLDSIKLGYQYISNENPRIIYVAISPYGHFTRKAEEFFNVPDSDLTAQAYNGYPSIIGDPRIKPIPLRAGIWAAWMMAAINAVIGVLLALYERLRSGKGQFIDVATHDALAITHKFPVLVGFLFGKSRPAYGFLDYIVYPFSIFKAKNGYVSIATPFDTDFRGLLKIIKRWDLEPDWKYGIDRLSDDIDRLAELHKEICKEIAKYSIEELTRRSESLRKGPARLRRLIGGPIIVKAYTLKEVINEKHWYIRNSLLKTSIDNKDIIIPNSPFKMSETPGRITIQKNNQRFYS